MKANLHLCVVMRAFVFLCLGTWMASVPAYAQEFTDWSAPTNAGSAVNSASNDQHPAISPDGLSLYFVSDRPGGSGGVPTVCSTIVPPAICPDLWVSQRESLDDPWQPAVPLNAAVNSPYAEFAPAFGANGRLLFFGSDRPGGCGSRDLWVSFRKNKRNDFGWQQPVNLGCIVNFSGFDDGPTYFDVERRDGDDRDDDEDAFTLYFTSQNRPGGLGDFDIWSTTMNRNGTFSTPVNITELNSPMRDTRTAIRKDGLEIILTSNRPGGAGLLDMWVATRSNSTAAWSMPVNLGPVVNGAANDGAPALSRDGKTLYFYSNRAGGLGANDLYVATRRKITGHDRERD